jgi:hypothetical protein
MPANLTHQYFAKKVAPQLLEQFPFMQPYESVLLLATQGPDPFFFYGQLPWYPSVRKQAVQTLGHDLHHMTGAESLRPLFASARSDLEKTYAVGALLHYLLDHIVHPYVFFRSGFDENGRLTPHYHSYHAHYETMIDILLRAHVRRDCRLRSMDAFRLPDSWLQEISRLYQRAYPDLQAHDYYYATLNMRDITRILYSPLGFKRFLISLLGKKRYAYTLSHTRRVPLREQFDYLNLKTSAWQNPVSGAESVASVLTLIETAEQLLSAQFAALHSWSAQPANPVDFTLPDINYDGEPSGTTKTMHASIYLKYAIL